MNKKEGKKKNYLTKERQKKDKKNVIKNIFSHQCIIAYIFFAVKNDVFPHVICLLKTNFPSSLIKLKNQRL